MRPSLPLIQPAVSTSPSRLIAETYQRSVWLIPARACVPVNWLYRALRLPTLLSRVLSAFNAEFPFVEIRLLIESFDAAAKALRDETVDLAHTSMTPSCGQHRHL